MRNSIGGFTSRNRVLEQLLLAFYSLPIIFKYTLRPRPILTIPTSGLLLFLYIIIDGFAVTYQKGVIVWKRWKPS